MKNDQMFNAHHSPVGAFSSFTLGYPGPSGGFGCELGKPADQHIFIGYESASERGVFNTFPFYEESSDAEEDFVLEDQGDHLEKAKLRCIETSEIEREFTPCIDRWAHNEFEFTIFSPTHAIPNPATASEEAMKTVLIPAVFAQLRLDNRKGDHDRRIFFGFQPSNFQAHIRENWNLCSKGIRSLCVGRDYGVASNAEGSNTAIHFTADTILGEPDRDRFHFGNGTIGLLDAVVPKGEIVTIPLVMAFHRSGLVTSGIECSYYYNRFFPNLDSVILHGLEHFESYRASAQTENEKWHRETLTDSQRFHIAHSIRSYYGSTQLLDRAGEPMWVVNEGEYRMINTLDLTIDQLFFEMKQNPWTTRNVLEHYLELYSYRDQVFSPGEPDAYHPGGLSFSHDMGVANCFTPQGESCYEISGLKGCFSYMTHEELVNWLCCALVYLEQTGDEAWAHQYLQTFKDLFESLCNRDHSDSEQRNGIMGMDSSRTKGGAEITTYDSLDPSLGRSRGNCYLATKTWSVYLGLEKLFRKYGNNDDADLCLSQSTRIMKTLLGAVREDGSLPSSIEPGAETSILPVIEGLVYAWFNGRKDVFEPSSGYVEFISMMRVHLEQVLKPGCCMFDDGSWRLTTGNTNSWLSKIYLCQFVARELLAFPENHPAMKSDEAHENWLKSPSNAYWAWGDQFYAGELKGSRYYPRGVTSVLWLDEKQHC